MRRDLRQSSPWSWTTTWGAHPSSTERCRATSRTCFSPTLSRVSLLSAPFCGLRCGKRRKSPPPLFLPFPRP
ncbi:hypothetical protein FOCC_FOCC017328 [Frankliniella occidentalis]|nr:hypothetical protein FOCC_FOCC017328 [Frankliniella occidentalis]